MFDPRGEPLVQHAFRRPVSAEALNTLRADFRERARRREARTFMPSGEDASRSLAFPVASDGPPRLGASGAARIPEAWLCAGQGQRAAVGLRPADAASGRDDRRARAPALTGRRRHRATARGYISAAVVQGELTGAELTRRLEPFGLPDRVAAIVIGRPGTGRGSPAPVEAAVSAALRDDAAPGLVASTQSLTCVLVAGMAEDELFAVGERVRARLSVELGSSVRVAVGRAVPGGEARRSFHEARCALEALGLMIPSENGSNGAGPDGVAAWSRVATYKDLGSFQLLLSLQDDEALKLFCDSILGPIEASEGHYGGELMRSLEAFDRRERAMGAGGPPALLPPSHAALPDPPGRGADRAQSGQRERSNRVLVGVTRKGAGFFTMIVGSPLRSKLTSTGLR